MYIHYQVRVKAQKHQINLAKFKPFRSASLCWRFLADSVSLSDGLCFAIVPFLM
jgi:hypothetical protein